MLVVLGQAQTNYPFERLRDLAVSDAERLRQVVITQISSFPEVFDERTSLLFEHRRKAVIEPA